MAEISFFFAGCFFLRWTKNRIEIQTASGIVRSTKEARVYIQELGTFLYVKFVEGSPSAMSLGRLCDGLEYSHSWQAGGNSTPTEGEKNITCCSDTFVPRVAVAHQKVNPSIRHDSREENPVPDPEVEEPC